MIEKVKIIGIQYWADAHDLLEYYEKKGIVFEEWWQAADRWIEENLPGAIRIEEYLDDENIYINSKFVYDVLNQAAAHLSFICPLNSSLICPLNSSLICPLDLGPIIDSSINLEGKPEFWEFELDHSDPEKCKKCLVQILNPDIGKNISGQPPMTREEFYDKYLAKYVSLREIDEFPYSE